MTYDFGKAFSGGRAISEDEMRKLPTQQLTEMRDHFSKPQHEKTDDLIDQRLSEELENVKRILESVESELSGRSDLARAVDTAENAVEDIAEVVGAADKCEAIKDTNEDMKRRLLRRSLDGSGTPCDNQISSDAGSRIRKKPDQE